jgi:large subunit ribosomal protein L24
MTKVAANIKKNDMVLVLAGKDKGKRGKVLKVLVKEQKLIVEGVNVYKKHKKATPEKEGGIIEKNMPIHVSNVRPINPNTQEPTTFRMKVLEDGKRVRVCKKTGEVIE